MAKSKTTGGQMQYQEKKTYNSGEPGMQKTKSSRDDRDRKNDRGGKRDDQKRESTPISDEQLNSDVKKLFSEYVSQKEAEFEREEEDAEEPPKPFDVLKFKRFVDFNGRRGS